MKGLLKVAAGFFIGCAILAAPFTASAALKVVAEPGADPAHVAMVQKTADTFNDVISAELGVTLDRDVKIFVCPTLGSYRDVLRREFGQTSAEADRIAKVSGGFP